MRDYLTKEERCGIVCDMSDNVREVRLLRDIRDQKGTKRRKGEILLATFHSEPSTNKGMCFPMYLVGVRLMPTEYELVLSNNDFNKLLMGEVK